jgi:hypothetical protein
MKNSKKVAAPAVAAPVESTTTRRIGKTDEQRKAKVTAYMNAALYNAKKLGNKQMADKIVATGLCSN